MGWKEEALAQGREALFVWQARIGGLLHDGAQFFRVHLGGRRHQNDAAHERGMIGGRHARHPVAEGMTGDHGRARLLAGDDVRDVAREILHADAFERARALAGATRLRPQHAIAGRCKAGCDIVEILGVAAARWQHDDQRPAPFGDQIYFDVVIAHDFTGARPFGGRRRAKRLHHRPHQGQSGDTPDAASPRLRIKSIFMTYLARTGHLTSMSTRTTSPR
jgi:hypothetical protein